MKGFKLLGIVCLIAVLVVAYELGVFVLSDFVIDTVLDTNHVSSELYTFALFINIHIITVIVFEQLSKLGNTNNKI